MLIVVLAVGAGIATYRIEKTKHARTARRYAQAHRREQRALAQLQKASAQQHQALLVAISHVAHEDQKAAVSEAQEADVKELQEAILTYQNEQAATNEFDEHASAVNCLPTTTISSATQVATFSCLAVTKEEAGGSQSGTSWTATYDFASGQFQWKRG